MLIAFYICILYIPQILDTYPPLIPQSRSLFMIPVISKSSAWCRHSLIYYNLIFPYHVVYPLRGCGEFDILSCRIHCHRQFQCWLGAQAPQGNHFKTTLNLRQFGLKVSHTDKKCLITYLPSARQSLLQNRRRSGLSLRESRLGN